MAPGARILQYSTGNYSTKLQKWLITLIVIAQAPTAQGQQNYFEVSSNSGELGCAAGTEMTSLAECQAAADVIFGGATTVTTTSSGGSWPFGCSRHLWNSPYNVFYWVADDDGRTLVDFASASLNVKVACIAPSPPPPPPPMPYYFLNSNTVAGGASSTGHCPIPITTFGECKLALEMLQDTSINPYDNFRGELASPTPVVDGYWHRHGSFPPWCYVMRTSDDFITRVQRPYFNADGSNANTCHYDRTCICKTANETLESSSPPPPAVPPPPILPSPPFSPLPADERFVTTTVGLLDALASTDVNVIWLAAGTFEVDGCTEPTDFNAQDAAIRRAAMLIARSVKIVGAGRDQTIIKKAAGGDSCRVISFLGGSSVVEVTDLTITGGKGYYDGCGASLLGGVRVVMRRVKVWRNACQVNDGGGGIRVMQGHLTMEFCLIAENFADNGGGGLRFSGGAGNTLTLSHNTFVDNLATSGACELHLMSAVNPTDVQMYNNTFLPGTANCAGAFTVSIETRIRKRRGSTLCLSAPQVRLLRARLSCLVACVPACLVPQNTSAS